MTLPLKMKLQQAIRQQYQQEVAGLFAKTSRADKAMRNGNRDEKEKLLQLFPEGARVSDVAWTEVRHVHPTSDREEVARVISEYDLVAVPVVDDAERVLGVVTVDDVIDVHYRVAMGSVAVQWERRDAPGQAQVAVDVDTDEGLGIEFESPTSDGIRICNNRCVFCFVDQSPAKMRRPLYLKDDDFRYSFLAANFVTLTNLSDDDWRKIKDQHLSPLYVSVHATDLVARRRLLGNPTAPDILEQIDRLASWGIRVHTQIVLVPGFNDGEVLERTVSDLAARWPDVLSLAIVPVGLTQQRFDRQDGLRRRLEGQLAKPDLDPIHREGLERRTASAPELRLLSAEEAQLRCRSRAGPHVALPL